MFCMVFYGAYFGGRNNRARVIIFVVGWGPGCGVGGPGGGFNTNRSSGKPLLLLLHASRLVFQNFILPAKY